MKKYAPLLTLMSVVLLGVGLVVANMLSAPARTAPPSPAVRAAPAPPAAAAVPGSVTARPGAPAFGPASGPAPAAVPAVPAVAQKAYTGRTAGNEATVAVVVKDGRVAAYVCNGKQIEAWFSGSLDADRLSLTGPAGSLTATVTGKATLGTVTVDGAEWPFAAAGVAALTGPTGGRASLADVAARVGWTGKGTG